MKLKYGKSNTYNYRLDNDRMNWLTSQTNRAAHQTQFLFNLVDGEFEKLVFLEKQMKNLFVFYCPTTKEQVDKFLYTKPKSEWFQYD